MDHYSLLRSPPHHPLKSMLQSQTKQPSTKLEKNFSWLKTMGKLALDSLHTAKLRNSICSVEEILIWQTRAIKPGFNRLNELILIWNTGSVAKFIFKLFVWGNTPEKLWHVRARDLSGGRRNRMVIFFSVRTRPMWQAGTCTASQDPWPCFTSRPQSNTQQQLYCSHFLYWDMVVNSRWKWMNPSDHTKSSYRSAVAAVSRRKQVRTPSMCFRNRATVLTSKTFPNLRSKMGETSQKEASLCVKWRQTK